MHCIAHRMESCEGERGRETEPVAHEGELVAHSTCIHDLTYFVFNSKETYNVIAYFVSLLHDVAHMTYIHVLWHMM